MDLGLDAIVEEFYGTFEITELKKITLELNSGKVKIEWNEEIGGWELVID